MDIVCSLPEERWRRFVDEHPLANVFHTPEMFQVFARAKGHQPTLWAVSGDSGEVLALLLPVHITLMGGPLRRLTTRAVAYGSVLYDISPEGKAALAFLLHTYAKQASRGVLFTELRNLSDTSAVQPVLKNCGFIYEEHLNYLIDLDRPIEDVMQGIGRRTRKHIRRGLKKQEVLIEEVSDRSQIKIAYELIRKSYSEAEVPLSDRSLFEAAYDVLHSPGMIKFSLARVEEAYVAASVELLFKGVMYGWYGGVDRDYASFVPGELLTWHLLRWGAENGYRVYDFGGAGKPDEEYGVRDFKAKFGGDLVCYGRNTFVHTPRLLRVSDKGYQLLRRWL